jgi:Ca2+-binding RTX toxin-like protein
VVARIFDSNGDPTTSLFLVNTATSGVQLKPEVTELENGNFVVVWESVVVGNCDVKGQIFTAAGTKVGTEFAVNSITAGLQYQPCITPMADGGFAVGWTDNANDKMKAQIFDAAGAKIGSEFLLDSGFAGPANLTGLPDGRLVSVWEEVEFPDGGGVAYAIKAQLFSVSGIADGPAIYVSDSSAVSKGSGSATLLTDGRLVFTWMEGSYDAGTVDVRSVSATLEPGIYGTTGNDALTGTSDADVIAGGAGADTIDGGDGNDTLYAGDISRHWSTPFFNNNPDYVAPVLDHGTEIDTLNGGAGVDRIFAGYGDIVDGGTDKADLLISLAGASAGVTVNFNALDNGGTVTIGGGLIQNVRSVLWIEGSNFDDTITGSNDGTDFGHQFAPIFGLGGNDHLIAGQNTGNIYGGDGNDMIEVTQSYWGWGNNGAYYGDAGDDTITVTGDGVSYPSASAFGGDGNDTLNLAGGISGGAGNDIINVTYVSVPYSTVAQGDEGDDIINDSDASDSLYGGDGADIISGNGGSDVLGSAGILSANSGWDLVDRGAERDVLNGGNGDDTVYAGYGDDVDGGAGSNSLSLSLIGASSGITLNVANLEMGGPVSLGGGTITNIQHVTGLWGSNFNDTLTLSSSIPVYGMGGDDTIIGTSAADEIHGGAGADIVNASDGDDTIYIDLASDIAAGEQVNGGAGNDTLYLAAFGESSPVSLVGVTLSGVETLKTFGATLGVTAAQLADVLSFDGNFYFGTAGAISLAGKSASYPVTFSLNAAGNQLDLNGFTGSSFIIVGGSDMNDTVIGSGSSDAIFGNGGDDEIYSGTGSDDIQGGDGNDLLDGGTGADGLYGGAGDDTYVVDSAQDQILEYAGEGADTVQASVTYTLAENVEILTLTGTGAINGAGNSLANVITGNSAANRITGDAGADTLTGGAGRDVFKDSAAGHNGDTITDFSIGDSIVITDASLASFTFSLSGNTLSYSGGSLTLSSVPAGHIVASVAAGSGVQLTVVPHDAHNDFNGDGRSDILWRNDDGTMRDWLAQSDGSFVGNIAHFNVNPGLAWHVAGTGDFNGDGRVDVLWRNDDGTMRDWLAQPDGSFVGNVAHFNVNPGLAWHVVGTGDFNGDGRDDVLWQNDDGTMRDWLGQPDGSFVGNIAHFNINPGLAWHVSGTGDFNGDGRDDVLWQNDDGTMRDWLGQADGSFVGNIAHFNVNPGASWHVVGTGDFNGDSRTDILWRNDDGTMRDWLGQADGSFVGNVAHFDANPGASWHVAGTGDFNGDAIDDILLQNTDGTVTNWFGQPDGSFVDNHLNINPGTTWHVQDPFVHDPFA